jgi:hypothetical protein
MARGITFVIIAVLILAIWVFVEFKRFRHKIWALILILVILFGYFSFTSVMKGKDVNLKTFSGIKEATGIYFVWLGHAFGNMKTITSNVVKMNWTNESSPNNNS